MTTRSTMVLILGALALAVPACGSSVDGGGALAGGGDGADPPPGGEDPPDPTPGGEDAPDPPPPDEPPACDACEGASATGLYLGWYCDLAYPFVIGDGISCEEARDNCQLNAGANPDSSFYCTWNGVFIHESEAVAGACDWAAEPSAPEMTTPDACDGAMGTGHSLAWDCEGGAPYLLTYEEQASCEDARDGCVALASASPGLSIYCVWEGRPVFETEQTAGACEWISNP